jgi:flavin-binding protein dodecin
LAQVGIVKSGARPELRKTIMSVASVTKITAASPKSFDDAIHSGIERASKTLRDITGFHFLEEKAKVVKGQISEYRVTMEITFVLENS